MIFLIQHFEADFLWKVSLKILNSGIILSPMIQLFVCVDALHPNHQFSSHAGTIPSLPGLNQY